MIKTKTVETIEEFDRDGLLIKKTVTETEETDDSPIRYAHTSTPYAPVGCACSPVYYGVDMSGSARDCGVT